jgi:uncharacterized phage-associated protein
MALDKNKFINLILYICSECFSLTSFGKTVLFKLLYFSDFDSYELTEKSITGEDYIKLNHGPAPTHFDRVIKDMKEKNLVKEVKLKALEFDRIKFVCLDKPDLSLFSAKELDIVNNVIKRLSGMTARQISAYSHGDMPWKATAMNDKIDYELVFYRDDIHSVIDNK